MNKLLLLSLAIFLHAVLNGQSGSANQKAGIAVIAYYSGNAEQIDGYPAEKLTHIIYSFCHLKGNRLSVDNAGDTLTIRKLVALKRLHPSLKVMLSLGGWGGCKECSPVFDVPANRLEFASSVKQLNQYFNTDGIDLDWEYPAISGHPGHPYKKEDRPNFTSLVQSLRDSLGAKDEISFAAGGFDTFLNESIEWEKVMPLVDRVNLMSYDLVNGFSKQTGHHTPLYPTKQQTESADFAIQKLKQMGIPLNKIVIGAAFYARTWEGVAPDNNGLFQSGTFKSFVPWQRMIQDIRKDKGFEFYYDSTAKASYAYNRSTKIFATFDDKQSIREKTNYAIAMGLNGIMFWELTLDTKTNGLLEVIDQTKKGK